MLERLSPRPCLENKFLAFIIMALALIMSRDSNGNCLLIYALQIALCIYLLTFL